MQVDKLWVAIKAFIKFNGKILIIRESPTYVDGVDTTTWDVVGGRVEPGQKWDESLTREIREEVGLEVSIGRPFYVGEWRPKVREEQWQIIGTFFECTTETDKLTLGEDHQEFLWIDPKNYKNYKLKTSLSEAFEAYLAYN